VVTSGIFFGSTLRGACSSFFFTAFEIAEAVSSFGSHILPLFSRLFPAVTGSGPLERTGDGQRATA
jgi:hypothetical protein